MHVGSIETGNGDWFEEYSTRVLITEQWVSLERRQSYIKPAQSCAVPGLAGSHMYVASVENWQW